MNLKIDSLYFIRIISQIFGANREIAFRPYLVEWGISSRRLYFLSFTLNNSDIRIDDKSFRVFHVSFCGAC